MDLRIASINGQGDAPKEHVYLEVTGDCDLSHYLVADTTFGDANTISNKLRHVFWFPTRKVTAGDAVSLWTGKGTNTKVQQQGGATLHRFYWNLLMPFGMTRAMLQSSSERPKGRQRGLRRRAEGARYWAKREY